MLLGGDRPGVEGLPGLSWVWAVDCSAPRWQNYTNFCVARASLKTQPAKPSQFLEAGKAVAGLGARKGSCLTLPASCLLTPRN